MSVVPSRRSARSPTLRVLKASSDNRSRSRSATTRAVERQSKVPPKKTAQTAAKAVARPKGAIAATTKAVRSAKGNPRAVVTGAADDKPSGQMGWVIANHVRSRRQEIGLNYLMCAPLSRETFRLLADKVVPRL